LRLHPARRHCRAPQPPGPRQLALLVGVPGAVEGSAVAERRVPERAVLRDHSLVEQEPGVRQVATGMPHLAEGSLPET